MQPDDYKSFLVRLWRNTVDDDAEPTWRGEVEHIQSGTCREFGTLGALLAFMQQPPDTLQPESRKVSGEQPP